MNNYVIYKGVEGLTHMLGGVVYCIDWCLLNNHKLLIDCNEINFSDYFVTNHISYIEDYELLKNEITNFDIEEIKNTVPKLCDLICNVYKLNDLIVSKSLYRWDKNAKVKIYCGNGGNNINKINKYIRIKPDVKNKIYQYNLHKKYKKYTGIHFRNTDKSNNINNYINNIKENSVIYIGTDNTLSLNIFKDYYPNKNIISYSLENENKKPLHKIYKNKNKIILNTIIDIYILSKSDTFYGSPNSLLTRLIHNIKENNNCNIFI